MSRLRSISFSQDIVERASNVGLVVPTIRVEELLQQRLARVDRQLTIEEDIYSMVYVKLVLRKV
jgi:hypothetical protein